MISRFWSKKKEGVQMETKTGGKKNLADKAWEFLKKIWGFVREHGFLGTLVISLFILCKSILFGIRKKDKTENGILPKWKNQWENAEGFDKEEDLFYGLFVKTYENVDKQTDKNRILNFQWKKFFLIIFLLNPLLKIVLTFLSILFGILEKYYPLFSKAFVIVSELNGWTVSLVEYAAFTFIWFLFAAVIAKWLDIKKYQETWVRHSDHKQKLESEMLKFIYKLDIYETGPVREKFMKEIIKIWDENQKVFSNNMNNKEKPLNDIIGSLKDLKESMK